MGINCSIDAEARIVRLEFVGEITIDEWTATFGAVIRNPTYQPGFGFLVDRRDAALETAEYVEHVVGFTILNLERLAGARSALVVATAASFEMATLGKTLAESADLPIPVQVFEDVDSAERWLRLSAPDTWTCVLRGSDDTAR